MYQGRFESKTVAARNMSRLQQQENAPTSQQCAPIPQLNENDEALQQLLVEQPFEQPVVEQPAQPAFEQPFEQPAVAEPMLEPTQPIPQTEEPEFLLPTPAPAAAPVEEAPQPKQKKGPRTHTIVFYTL